MVKLLMDNEFSSDHSNIRSISAILPANPVRPRLSTALPSSAGWFAKDFPGIL
ncbi:MAG: hypothetical protein ACXV7J_05435 [Methylomonas sp.]